jgi:hypothetical protein
MIYKEFSNLVNAAVRLNAIRASSLQRINYSDRAWADLNTVHINIGRQTGKTSYIANNCTKNDLVILVDNHLVKQFNAFPQVHTRDINVISAGSKIFPDIVPGRIFIDEPSYVFRKMPLYDIIDRFYKSDNCQIIMLGQ